MTTVTFISVSSSLMAYHQPPHWALKNWLFLGAWGSSQDMWLNPDKPQKKAVDELVIGAGLYGVWLALALSKKGASVVMIDPEDKILNRASRNNQLRIHNGYHYPRSFLTAARSRSGYLRFRETFADCVVGEETHLYAIANQDTKVNAKQFGEFCTRVGIPLLHTKQSELARRFLKRFKTNSIEALFQVQESCYDPNRLRANLAGRLENSTIDIRLGLKPIKLFQNAEHQWEAQLTSADGAQCHVRAKRIWNCTYAHIDEVRKLARLSPLGIRQERAELCIIETPNDWKGVGLTVMCGPFFSLLPTHLNGPNEHSLSHVRYTPNLGDSTFEHMKRDVTRFLPEASEWRYKRSVIEWKALLPATDIDDGRPILWHSEPTVSAPFVSVMGGKLDNVFEIEQELKRYS